MVTSPGMHGKFNVAAKQIIIKDTKKMAGWLFSSFVLKKPSELKLV